MTSLQYYIFKEELRPPLYFTKLVKPFDRQRIFQFIYGWNTESLKGPRSRFSLLCTGVFLNMLLQVSVDRTLWEFDRCLFTSGWRYTYCLASCKYPPL